MAEQLKCDECQEGQLTKPSVAVSLEKEEKIWNTMQMDVFFYKHGNNVHHFLIMLDEACGFAISAELLVHTTDIHANVDTPSVIEALEGSWFQYFGHPRRIRCDLEGAFRGRELEAYTVPIVASNFFKFQQNITKQLAMWSASLVNYG